MEQTDLLLGALNAYIRQIYKLVFGKDFMTKRYAGKIILCSQKANSWLYKHILSNAPFMAARYGGVELKIMQEYILIQHGIKKNYDKNVIKMAKINAGVFDANEDICKKFALRMMSASGEVDLLGVWFNWVRHKVPWTHALRGKKVLVVHPFDKSISEQYKKKDLLFPDGLLPEFELITFRAVQTIAGVRDDRFKTWFEALHYMEKEIRKIDFDIAIIGCGAYGFLLAEAVKKMGKQAIHLGGATQILFGIKGKRWDTEPTVSKLYNEHWVRPQKEECPPQRRKVESGCYW